MLSSDAIKIGPELGVDYHGGVVILYDTRGYSASRLTVMDDDEIQALIGWYTEGLCRICFKQRCETGGVGVCDECLVRLRE